MTSEKRKLILNLNNDSFSKIGVSKIHGVGVVAIKDIPEKVNVFVKSNEKFFEKMAYFNEQELTSLFKSNIISFLKHFFAKNTDGNYYFPIEGLNSLDVSFYLNHSNSPNLKSKFDPLSKSAFLTFFSIREIKEGEELTINYFEEFGKEAADDLLI